MMTFETLRSVVQQTSGRTDKEELISQALNMAYTEITGRHFFKVLSKGTTGTLQSGGSKVELEPDTYQIIEVRLMLDTQSYVIPVKSKTWCTNNFPLPDSLNESKPTLCYEEDGFLNFIPHADQDYIIRWTYWQKPPALSADNDTPVIEGIDSALTAWAASWVFKTLEKFAEADRWMMEYERSLDHAITLDRKRYAIDRTMDQHQTGTLNINDPAYDPFAKDVYGSRMG